MAAVVYTLNLAEIAENKYNAMWDQSFDPTPHDIANEARAEAAAASAPILAVAHAVNITNVNQAFDQTLIASHTPAFNTMFGINAINALTASTLSVNGGIIAQPINPLTIPIITNTANGTIIANPTILPKKVTATYMANGLNYAQTVNTEDYLTATPAVNIGSITQFAIDNGINFTASEIKTLADQEAVWEESFLGRLNSFSEVAMTGCAPPVRNPARPQNNAVQRVVAHTINNATALAKRNRAIIQKRRDAWAKAQFKRRQAQNKVRDLATGIQNMRIN